MSRTRFVYLSNRLSAAAVLAAGLALGACASTGAPGPAASHGDLVGYWQAAGSGGQTVAQFKNDGTFRVMVRNAGGMSRHQGAYTVQGDRVRLTSAEPGQTVLRIQGNTLQNEVVAEAAPNWLAAEGGWLRMQR